MSKLNGNGTRRLWAVLLWTAAFAAVEVAGCGLFDIRDRVAPVAPKGCHRASTVDPESVLVNFESALGCKGSGLSQYEETLAEEFHLVLDVIDAQELGTGLDSLSKVQDVNTQQILIQAVSDSFHFAFDRVEPVRTGGTALYLDMPYELQLIRAQGDSFVVAETIQGTADVSLAEQQAGGWAMTRWVDQRIEGFKSFGRWHGERVVAGAPEPGTMLN